MMFEQVYIITIVHYSWKLLTMWTADIVWTQHRQYSKKYSILCLEIICILYLYKLENYNQKNSIKSSLPKMLVHASGIIPAPIH